MPLLRTSYLSSYFVSGAVHASVAGIAYWGMAAGWIAPGYGIQHGGANGNGGVVWAPTIESPFETGNLAPLLGDRGEIDGLKITLVDPAAVSVLDESPLEVEPIDIPSELPPRVVVAPAPVFVPSQVVKLDEPKLREPEPPRVEASTPDVAAELPEPRVTPLTETHPEPEEKSSAPASVFVPEAAATPSTKKADSATSTNSRTTPSLAAPPTAEDKPVTEVASSSASVMKVSPSRSADLSSSTTGATPAVTKRTGESASGNLAGATDGQTNRAAASTASVPAPSSGLPPGAQPDVRASELPNNPAPPYPPEAYQLGQEGEVQLLVTITEQGTVSQLKVFRSSGIAALDESALKTVRDWKFRPAKYREQPVRSRVLIPVSFNIGGR